MNDEEANQIVKAAASIVIDAVVGLIQVDSHTWSNRPCQSCLDISGMIGKPFGCYKHQEDLKNRKGG